MFKGNAITVSGSDLKRTVSMADCVVTFVIPMASMEPRSMLLKLLSLQEGNISGDGRWYF